jgi:molybdopterin-guanine dinucleotide biosynthesis protein B
MGADLRKSLQVKVGSRIPPIVSVVGYSGSGKTTLIEKLIPELIRRGVQVATIKHDVHGFEMDKPGKDSWRHKQAGAGATIISSPKKIGLVMDVDHDHQPEELALLFGFADLILTEGYKQGLHPKVEIFRPAATGNLVPLCRQDDALIAMVSNEAVELAVPRFGLEDADQVAEFLVAHFALPRQP